MPLKKGKSKKVMSSNISEMMHKFTDTGMIGTSAPASKGKAQKQAVAMNKGGDEMKGKMMMKEKPMMKPMMKEAEMGKGKNKGAKKTKKK